jgi:anti-sigma regulatory factor (Ser/Thr protein kinase)
MKEVRSFEHTPESVTAARRFATEALRHVPGAILEAVELMVSELASNCIRHTGSRFDVAIIQSADVIRVEATDVGGGEPTKRSPGPTDPSGRGLQIVDMLSAEWGVEQRAPVGKTVWFTVQSAATPMPDSASASRQRAASGPRGHTRMRESRRRPPCATTSHCRRAGRRRCRTTPGRVTRVRLQAPSPSALPARRFG